MSISQVPYTAKGHAGIVDSVFTRQFWLDAGGQPTFESHTVASGQVLVAGAVLGMVTATNKLVFCDPAAGDGSEVPYAILVESLNTSATGLNADEVVNVIATSNRQINLNALVRHSSWGKHELRAALSRRGISVDVPFHSAL